MLCVFCPFRLSYLSCHPPCHGFGGVFWKVQTDSSHSDLETGINAGVVVVVVVVVGCLLLYRLPHKSTDKTTVDGRNSAPPWMYETL